MASVNAPLVSICIPTYNRPRDLSRAVESVVAQTYKNWEIIITDNSPGNESADIAAKWTDPRIRYFKNGGNCGPTISSNRAFLMARGKYVQLLMDDDLIKPKFLELMVDAFEKNPTVGVVMAPLWLIDAEDRRIFPKFYLLRTMQYRYRYQVGDGLIARARVLRDFLTRDYPCCVPSGILYRAKALPFDPAAEAMRGLPFDATSEAWRLSLPFDPAADFAGDLLASIKIAAQWDFYYIDEVLSSWRFIPKGHTAALHQTGLKITVFYAITREILAMESVREMFRDDWDRLRRDSLFFCTCRAVMLNGLAALRARSLKQLLDTIKTAWREDGYLFNFLRLPLWVMGQIWVSIFPARLPPPRE
jgi:glycosyltransferase involved in cell wall biosynthesis